MKLGTNSVAGLYEPRPIRVRVAGTVPAYVAGTPVDSVRERWLIEDRWWSSNPLRRDYFEVVLATGRCMVVFYDLENGRWYEQR